MLIYPVNLKLIATKLNFIKNVELVQSSGSVFSTNSMISRKFNPIVIMGDDIFNKVHVQKMKVISPETCDEEAREPFWSPQSA